LPTASSFIDAQTFPEADADLRLGAHLQSFVLVERAHWDLDRGALGHRLNQMLSATFQQLYSSILMTVRSLDVSDLKSLFVLARPAVLVS